jgi:hypothetical protein
MSKVGNLNQAIVYIDLTRDQRQRQLVLGHALAASLDSSARSSELLQSKAAVAATQIFKRKYS